jgi:hypothetical protein
MEPTITSGEAHDEERLASILTNTETLAAASALVNPVGGGAEPLGDV